MNLRDLPATLARRWYLTVVGVLGTLGLCLLTYVTFGPTYEAQANVVLLPPATSVGKGGNPYLQLADLGRVVDVMTRALSSQSTVDAINVAAPGGTYTVADDYTTNSPIFIITADDKTPRSTLATLKAVTDTVGPTLASLQEALAIAPQSQITSSTLTSDSRPTSVRKSQIRALIVAAGVGALGSAMLIALIDSFLVRRARRRTNIDATPASAPNVAAGPRSDPVSADRQSAPAPGTSGRTRRSGLRSPSMSDHEVIQVSTDRADSRPHR